jgi:multidrug efflux pump subunit AcrA (membrane-fusion protein)
LLFASFKVIVTVEEAIPLAMTGPVPVIVEFTATAAPAVKRTVPSDFETGVTIESVLVSAASEVKEQVAIPEASLAEHAP